MPVLDLLRRLRRADRTPAAVVALAIVGFHLLTARGYGYFRDELYYLACGEHLGLGYVDHPPLIGLVAWAVRHTLGESLVALRLLPAVAAGVTAYLTGRLAGVLGGGRWAQLVAALAAAVAPVYLSLFSILSMNAFDVALWTAALFLAARLLRDGPGRRWLLFGLVVGIGLENKVSIGLLAVGVVAGLAVAREWRHLRSPWLWLGAALALLLFLPHLGWQAAHGWPTRELIANATQHKNVALSPGQYLGEQVLMLNPFLAPLWLGGLGWLLFAAGPRPFRALAFAYLAVLAIMLATPAKPYYLAPAYPLLLAAGAVAAQRLYLARPQVAWLRPIAPVIVLAAGAQLAPLAKPLLPVDKLVAYTTRLGMRPRPAERGAVGRLPQLFADMHGWPELAATVAGVYHRLAPAERAGACIYAQNYGQAAAIDFFGRAHGLPRAISGHNSYYLWGPRGCDGRVVIQIGGTRESVAPHFRALEEGARYTCRDCMPYEARKTIWVGRGLKLPLAQAWAATKRYE